MAINRDYDQEGFRWRSMLVLSLLMHGMLFSVLFWVPGHGSGGLKMNEAVYEVNLVDDSKIDQLKGRTSAPAVKKSTPADTRKARRISASSRQKNTVTVSKRTAKRIKSKPEKDQVSSNQLLDRAISRIEKKVKTENDNDYLDKDIARLDKKLDSSGGVSGSGVQAGSLALNIYKMEAESLIKSNWSYSDALGNYEAIVLVKVRKDGKVLETHFIKRSGNNVFDESVIKAIELANPLPPLPEGYKENYEEIEITFNLKDLE
ncbi:MAG: energy transducer TonB [Desulfobacteraceae bacterium]|jgi:TonB family protein